MSLSISEHRKKRMGRVLISENDFQRGDIVFEEKAILTGPCYQPNLENTPFTCVGCNKAITAIFTCPECHFPCCSISCSREKDHKRFECRIYTEERIPCSLQAFYNITVIRMMLYKEMEPEKYKEINELCSNFPGMDPGFEESRKERAQELWQFASIGCGLDISFEEAYRILKISIINSFKFCYWNVAGQGIYVKSSLLPNECAPAMEFSFFESIAKDGTVDRCIRFHARRNIKKGDLLTISYAPNYILYGTEVRQAKMTIGRGFRCYCARCRDKTEGQSYFSALKCPECLSGNLLHKKPSNPRETRWRCDSCKEIQEGSFVIEVIQDLKSLPCYLSTLSEGTPESVAMADAFIESESGILMHANHYLIYRCARHYLLWGMYSFAPVFISPAGLPLFHKCMKRVVRYLPIAFEIDGSQIVADLLSNVARAYAAIYFKSVDLDNAFYLTPVLGRDHRDKLRALNKIVYFLKEALVWVSMKPCDVFSIDKKAFLEEKLQIWTGRHEKFCVEVEERENLALEAIRFLFV